MDRYRKLLVPLDGSKLAECSLAHAKAISKGCGSSTLILLRVIEPLSANTISALGEAGGDALARVEAQTQNEARSYIAALEASLKADGLVVRAVTVKGNPPEEIMAFSQKNDVDLIVMSTHGRSGPSRFFFGSVAERVSRHSPIPVLMVSPQGCRTTDR